MAVKHLSTSYNAAGSTLNITKPLSRFSDFPLDATGFFESIADAEKYAKEDPHAYVGQIINVINGDTDATPYVIKNTDGDLKFLSGVENGDGKIKLVYDDSLNALKFVFE